MIIIAESGSTKTNWLTAEKELFTTIGFNPLFFTPEVIVKELQQHTGLNGKKADVSAVYFYGASCSSPDRNKIIEDALKQYFTSAGTIEVGHDLSAAAIATYTGQPGIACILGTGSNSCLYDGNEITEVVPALGYVLGDEGGGAYFGKKLLSLYLYNELPEATMKLMREEYKLEKEEIFDCVYKKPHANVYLAGFAKILTESPDKGYMEKLAEEGFADFFKHHVCCYENYTQYPIHFVGSIAFFYKDAIQRVADKFGCKIGIIDRSPVYRLLDHHLQR